MNELRSWQIQLPLQVYFRCFTHSTSSHLWYVVEVDWMDGWINFISIAYYTTLLGREFNCWKRCKISPEQCERRHKNWSCACIACEHFFSYILYRLLTPPHHHQHLRTTMCTRISHFTALIKHHTNHSNVIFFFSLWAQLMHAMGREHMNLTLEIQLIYSGFSIDSRLSDPVFIICSPSFLHFFDFFLTFLRANKQFFYFFESSYGELQLR